MATKFYPVADKSEFSDNDQLHVSLNDEEILLCREEEDYFAISYYCSHATLSLEGGYIYKSKIICPYHGAEFCLKTGNALTPPAYEAIKKYKAAIMGDPNNYVLHFNLAVAYRFIGELGSCENSLNTCLRLNSQDSEAQSMRSSLKKQTVNENHIDELLEISKDLQINSVNKSGIYYALGKELDDLDEFNKSFSFLKKASKLRRGSMQYDVEIDTKIMSKLKETFKNSSINKSEDFDSGPTPIFILGLPRTGSTLLERILDCHSEIISYGELDYLGREIVTLCREITEDKKLSTLKLIEYSKNINFADLKNNFLVSYVGEDKIIRKAKEYGNVIVGLMTDKAMMSYKRKPKIPFEGRLEVSKELKSVKYVLPIEGINYSEIASRYKFEFFLHGDDWKTNIQAESRKDLIEVMKSWGGVVIDIPYTEGCLLYTSPSPRD